MKADKKVWLDEYAVTCRVFKGRWNVRHCMRMYNDIKGLKFQVSSRAKGKVTRYESAYNPCERCKVLTRHISSLNDEQEHDTKAGKTFYNRNYAADLPFQGSAGR